VDGVNFSNKTVWEGEIHAGSTYQHLPDKFDHQFVSYGTALSQIEAETYEILLSSDCLEHIANPIKALLEWKRVLKSNYLMLLILPNKKVTLTIKERIPCFNISSMITIIMSMNQS
jgi:ubiquinone/menaquinone biosynthesis C-methylase UbiE